MIYNKDNSDVTLATHGIIAHGVNCQGVMGSGVALAIRNKWPAVYDAYLANNRIPEEMRGQLLGSCHIIRVGEDLWVANCYTQLNYGKDGTKYASVDAIRRSLGFVFSHANATGLPIHAPRIGAGLGGLDWDTEVLPVFEDLNSEYLDGVNVVIHTI